MCSKLCLWLPAFLLTALILAGCGAVADLPEPDAHLQLVATTTIVGDIVRQVAGEQVDLVVLLPVGVDPHAYEPRPQDVVAITKARLVFANGAGLEEFLQPVLESAGAQDRVVEVSKGIELLPYNSASQPPEEAGHVLGDPHTWLDPNNVILWSENISAALSAADPAHAPEYEANAQRYIAALRELDAWIAGQVAQLPPGQRKLVSDHRVLSYFAKAYGFELLGEVIGSFSTNAQPSAQELANLEDHIRQFAVPVIFVDQTANPNLSEQVAQDTGIRIVRLYAGSLGEAGSPAEDYLGLMRYNVNAIVNALKE